MDTNYIIFLLIFVVVGMLIAAIYKLNHNYRGPNAASIVQKQFYDSKSNGCFKFKVVAQECPLIKKNYQKILDKLIN